MALVDNVAAERWRCRQTVAEIRERSATTYTTWNKGIVALAVGHLGKRGWCKRQRHVPPLKAQNKDEQGRTLSLEDQIPIVAEGDIAFD